VAQQGPCQPAFFERHALGHGGEAAHPGAPQGLEQEGLQLVVRVLGQQQHLAGMHRLAEHGVAPLPGHRLQALAGGGRDLHAVGFQRHAEARAESRAMLLPA